ncbi:Hypothetical predicted protein [Lecanosticta acicola]|uniref:Uncharacterized protein n=1 Tax=Lecanosticta acicola TaxID=111012 RepID=A0AAI8YSV5_9PEZI|nr:Hypothetical predicted protein [Lecanosticta acicola]
MGEIASSVRPAPPQTLPFHSKLSAAEHVEDTSITSHDLGDRPAKRQRSSTGLLKRPNMSTATGATDTPVDSFMNTPNRSKDNLHTDQAPPTQTKDWQPAPQADEAPWQPPAPLRDFPHLPKLWVDYEPPTTSGEAVATWVEAFVPVVYDCYKDWPPDQRTREFDRLIKHDEDRYRNVLVRFYHDHPHLIPDRPRAAACQKYIDFKWNETPASVAKMKLVFRSEYAWDPRAPVVGVEDPVGPKGEADLGDEVCCKHCVKRAKIARWTSLARRVVKPKRKASSVSDSQEVVEEPREAVSSSSCSGSGSGSSFRSSGGGGAGDGGGGGGEDAHAHAHADRHGGGGRRWAIGPRASTQVERPAAVTA